MPKKSKIIKKIKRNTQLLQAGVGREVSAPPRKKP
jgi:hypothetical protein